ncbi:hypothetical protein GYH30_047152 [Glycine max]|nr:hypothetical protein GYH30_047152 [Glycine max]
MSAIRGGGEVTDNDNPGLDVREVAGAEHEAEEGGSVERVVDLGGGDSKEAEAICVEAVKLAFIVEARDDGLGVRERRECVLVRELEDQAIETGGVREVRGVRVGEPSFFNFAIVKEGEKLMIADSEEVGAVARWKGESGCCKRVTFIVIVPSSGISSSNYLYQVILLSKQ